jgi:hypothetical protein
VTSNRSFIRKVAYIAAIGLLLLPLSLMSRPATVYQPGGALAEMRRQEGLSQAELGAIDPASESMKLATVGLRGVAVAVLWNQANEYKKKEDWDNLAASLTQIARLQPNFVSVWEFQAHNMSYNVSVEFDDYRQRYHWVKKGIDYLIEGTNYNRNDPRLLWYAGWVIGQKLGRADEKQEFRRLFREDLEFHQLLMRQQIDVDRARGPEGPDNWLVGREWYLKAQRAVDNEGKSLGNKSPALFHSSPVMSRINFADATEKVPGFDAERVRAEWRTAGEEWAALGRRQLSSSLGISIQLGGVAQLKDTIEGLERELDALLPGVRERLRQERVAKLPPDMRRALEKPFEERSMAEQQKAYQAEPQVFVGYMEVAQEAPGEKSVEARRVAQRLNATVEQLRLTESSRHVVNYAFWEARCAAGADEVSTLARRRLFEAKDAFQRTDLEEAKDKFEQSFDLWAEVLRRWPLLLEDADNDDLVKDVEIYIKVLDQLDLRDASGGVLPPDFPLSDLVRYYQREELLQFRKAEPDSQPTPDTPASNDSPPSEPTAEENPTDEAPADDASANEATSNAEEPAATVDP